MVLELWAQDQNQMLLAHEFKVAKLLKLWSKVDESNLKLTKKAFLEFNINKGFTYLTLRRRETGCCRNFFLKAQPPIQPHCPLGLANSAQR